MKVLEDSKRMVIKGEVIRGRQIGRTIGFPTANICVSSDEEPYLPRGVYAVNVYHEGAMYHGVMNIGKRPTFKEEEQTLSFEVHILHFNQDIYGEQLMVDILFFIRDEQTFESVEQLVLQMKHDIGIANQQFLLAN